MRKRLLSFVLAMIMLVGLVSAFGVTAMAEDEWLNLWFRIYDKTYSNQSNVGEIKFKGNTFDGPFATQGKKGETYAVEAVPSPGYKFVEWRMGSSFTSASIVSTSAIYNFTMTTETMLWAVFEEGEVTNYIIKQPTGGTADVGSGFNITYAANFTPKEVELYCGSTPGSGYWISDVGNTSATIPAKTSAGSENYYLKFITASDGVIYSNIFTVTWVGSAYQKGDVNRDGDLDNADLILVARYVVNLITFDSEAFKLGDMDDSGEIDNADIIRLARLLVGLN